MNSVLGFNSDRIISEENDLRVYESGREVCLSDQAWNVRRKEIWERDERRCQCTKDCPEHIGKQCGKFLALTMKLAIELRAEIGHVHHKTKRGMGGGTRDDQKGNLVLFCWKCHAREKE